VFDGNPVAFSGVKVGRVWQDFETVEAEIGFTVEVKGKLEVGIAVLSLAEFG